MTVDTNTMVSITEANQNFSKVARLVDELGSVVILKNNAPKYLVIDFSKADESAVAKDEDMLKWVLEHQELNFFVNIDKANKIHYNVCLQTICEEVCYERKYRNML